MSEVIISIKNVTHEYFNKKKRKSKIALKDVSLNIKKGEVFGLLGPNGAGKSTLIKIMTTLLISTLGKVTIFGKDIIAERNYIRKHIGLVIGGERGLYWKLTGKENLYLFAELYNLKPDIYKKRVEKLLSLVGLAESKDQLVSTYSKGMKQRLHIAKGLLIDPDILFMDEPTLGLDVQVAIEIKKIIKDLAKLGKTIIYTTHYMHEAEEICDRIAFLKEGRVVEIDSPENLKNKLRETNIVSIYFSEFNRNDLTTKDILSKELGIVEPIARLAPFINFWGEKDNY